MNNGSVNQFSSNNKLISELDALNTLIEAISERYQLSTEEVVKLLDKKREKANRVTIPSCVLRDRNLGVLEAVTKYLREEKEINYHGIGIILGRDERVIWTSYSNAVKKVKSRFKIENPNHWIDISAIVGNNLGLLESIVVYFRDQVRLTNSQIAILLNRDNKTIWASYNNAKSKVKNG